VLGRTPFGDELDNYFTAHPLKNRQVKIRYCTEPSEIGDCDLLFICSSEKPRLANILFAVKAKSILTMADSEGFARQGVMINLVQENQKMVIEVNIGPSRESRFRMNSGFLQIARIISHN
jgi:hypothetical protein